MNTASVTPPDLYSYDHIIVAFSGGKDSLACVLTLLEQGVPAARLELWHHEVDGYGEDHEDLMDWPCTSSYVGAFADAFQIRLYRSWKHGGFARELLRQHARTAPISFEAPDQTGQTRLHTTGGSRGKLSTRRVFPQTSANLNVRWCSAYLKIDVARTALRNQQRFRHAKTLIVSGERAEESPSRAKYAAFAPDDTDLRNGKNKRHVDRCRPILHWDEQAVWKIIERWRVNPHPAYRIGWSRCSCAGCIFGGANEFASLQAINPDQVNAIISLEKQFGKTIKRDETLPSLIAKGQAFDSHLSDREAALSPHFNEAIILEQWTLPAGAFRNGQGPS